MIKIIVLTFLLQIFLAVNIFAQDTINFKYYDNLKFVLKKDLSLNEIKYIETRYSNGKIKFQGILVKLKNDSNNRFWQVGKSFGYYKNGKLKGYSNVDLITKTQIDTSYWYDKYGRPKKITIFSDCLNNRLLANTVFKNQYVYYPCKFTEMIYINGKIWIKRDQVYCEKKRNLYIDGEVIYYKDDGMINKKIIYECGKKVK
jgi:hypothetical protein